MNNRKNDNLSLKKCAGEKRINLDRMAISTGDNDPELQRDKQEKVSIELDMIIF